MKTRNYNWLDVNTWRPRYGIQVFHEGIWKNAHEGGTPLLFDTPEERDEKRKEIRKQKESK